VTLPDTSNPSTSGIWRWWTELRGHFRRRRWTIRGGNIGCWC